MERENQQPPVLDESRNRKTCPFFFEWGLNDFNEWTSDTHGDVLTVSVEYGRKLRDIKLYRNGVNGCMEVRYANALSGQDVDLTFVGPEGLFLGSCRAEGREGVEQVLRGPSYEQVIEQLGSKNGNRLALRFVFTKPSSEQTAISKSASDATESHDPGKRLQAIKQVIPSLERLSLNQGVVETQRQDPPSSKNWPVDDPLSTNKSVNSLWVSNEDTQHGNSLSQSLSDSAPGLEALIRHYPIEPSPSVGYRNQSFGQLLSGLEKLSMGPEAEELHQQDPPSSSDQKFKVTHLMNKNKCFLRIDDPMLSMCHILETSKKKQNERLFKKASECLFAMLHKVNRSVEVCSQMDMPRESSLYFLSRGSRLGKVLDDQHHRNRRYSPY